MSYSKVQRAYREHLQQAGEPDGDAVRIWLQSNATIDPLAAYLWQAARAESLPVQIQVGGFDQISQDALDEEGPLHQFDPHVVFLFPIPSRERSATELTEATCSAALAIQARSSARVVISNAMVPRLPFRLHQPAWLETVAQANQLLLEQTSAQPGIWVLDLESLASHWGKQHVVNHKLHYLGNIEFSPEFQEVLAHKCLTWVRLCKRTPYKCAVVDLDDTLWGGVVGELGPNGITLARHGPGSEFRDFQHALFDLYETGVLLAINSKNNPEDALEALDGHPDMRLRREHFAAMQINWQDKATNMRAIAEELNIGLDSLVFFDNSPVERGWVRDQLPEVLVPELPEDPAYYASFLEAMDVFERPTLTEEDRQRAAMYAQQRERKTLEQSTSSLAEYLKQLDIELTIAPVDPSTLPRAAQLCGKTNQFNLTTRRHDEGALRAMMESPDHEVYVVSVQDRYGSNGITGVAILRFEERACYLDTFLLSCRVLGRRVEDSFLAVLMESASRRAEKVIGEYIPTRKNRQTASFYEERGFDPVSEGNSVRQFEFRLEGASFAPVDVHRICLRTGTHE